MAGQMDEKLQEKLQLLSELGAGDFEHINGSLQAHLEGTHALLVKWGASETLQHAGLFHAAYGTAGFSQHMVAPTQREKIAAITGAETEELVYQYCACDRQIFFARFAQPAPPLFVNRFTFECYYLSHDMLLSFCELTAANETEIAMHNREFMQEHGEGLRRLFTAMTPYLSEAALCEVKGVFSVS